MVVGGKHDYDCRSRYSLRLQNFDYHRSRIRGIRLLAVAGVADSGFAVLDHLGR